MFRLAFISLLSTLIFGCATPNPSYHPSINNAPSPEIGTIQKRTIGDKLVSYSRIKEYDALLIESEEEYKVTDIVYQTVPIQTAFAYQYDADTGNIIYYVETEIDNKWGWSAFLPYWRVKELPNGTFACLICSGWGGKIPLTNTITKTKSTKDGDPYFVQDLIYNGIENNNLKFIYREYTNRLRPPDYVQDVQYDLKNSKIIAFKTVKLEILEATNEYITYKVLSHFDGVM